ncbi:MAG: efflux RND transporter periplasmic adaptor subunit [Ignavibacteriales bacterium]|nr:MAG: efflux RND transporter periplasmic adaptor subunit [Ignavibacteriales bacterium]
METKNADLSALKIDRSNNDKPSSGKKNILFVLGFVILLVVVYFILSSTIFSSSVDVKTTTAVLQKPGQVTASLTASGYVVAQREAAIASKGTGRLIYLGVVEGDKVKKDQVIGRLESTDIAAQLDEAKANLLLYQADLTNSENTFKREKELFEKGLSSQQVFDQAESNLNRLLASIEIAKARIKQYEVALENTLIRAPFDGTVLTKNAEVGEIVAPFGGSTTSKTAVVTIADMHSLLVEADVSESNIERIKVDQDCEIILDAYPEKSYAAYVYKIVPTADRSKATVLVKVGFKKYDDRVLPEMSAKVSFFTQQIDSTYINQKPILVVPASAVRKTGTKIFVYKIVEGKAKELEVTLGQELGSYHEILSGLGQGDKIIIDLTESIQNGVEVKVE